MPVVEMHDGTELEFPDSMTREEMRSAILSKYPTATEPVETPEPTETEKAAASRAETSALVRSSRMARGVPAATPIDTDEQRRADALQQIQQGQEQSKYFTEKARELGLAESALNIPAAIKTVINIPNRLTGQPDYPSLVSPEQAEKVREFLANSREVPSLPVPRFDLVAPEKAKEINAASERAVNQLVSGLSAPENVAAAVLAKRYPTPVTTYFEGETLGAIPETTQRFLEAKSMPEAVEAGIPAAANLAFAKVLGSHLTGPEAPRLPENVRPFGKPSDRAIPFPESTGRQESLAAKARADYIAEQKAALEAPAEVPPAEPLPAKPAPVTESTLNRLEQEAKGAEIATAKPEEAKTPEQVYDESLDTFRKASKDFRQITDKYRAKEIGDAEFLAARAAFDKASEVADKAETDFIAARNVEPTQPAEAKAEEVAKETKNETETKTEPGVGEAEQQTSLHSSDLPSERAKGVEPAPAAKAQGEVTHLPRTNIPTPEESARWDKVTAENKARLDKLSANQISQVAVEAGLRPRQADKLLSDIHPDDLKAAIDAVTKTPIAKVQAEVSKVAKTEGVRSAKEVKSELVQRIEDEIAKGPQSEAERFAGLYVKVPQSLSESHRLTDVAAQHSKPLAQWLEEPISSKDKTPNRESAMGQRFVSEALEKKGVEKITIDIPGDGTFKIWNTKEALGQILERAKKLDTAASRPTEVKKSGIPKEDADWVRQQIAEQQAANNPAEAYFIRTGDAWKPAAGKKVVIPGFEEFDFFVSKTADGTRYTVTEARSGNNAGGFGPTEKKAIEATKERLSRIENANAVVRDAIKNSVEKYGESPRFKQPPPEPPNAGAEGISVGPGSASPEDIGSTKSDMQQLAESMQNVASPKLTMEDRLSAAKKAVQTLKTEGPRTIGEQIRNGVERLSATASAIKTGLTKLPDWTNFKRILGQWDGANQIADHELRDFVKTINRNIRENRQVAITNWIQAGGDAAVLRERAAASKTAKLRKGYEDALTLNKDEITAAKNIESYLESRLQAGIDSGILDHGLDNYVTQIWKRPNPATQKLVSDIAIGKLQPNFRYARQRLLESYFQGEQLGFTPANKKVSALIAAYDQSFNRAIAARGFIKNLTKGTASDGRPLVEVSGSGRLVGADEANPEAMLIKPKSKSEEIADYRSVDHPALRKWKWAGETPEGTPVLLEGQLLVHPEIYTHLRNILGRSAWRQYAIPRAILGIERGIKELMFSASGFHQVQETLHALGHRVNPMNMEKVDFSQPWQKEAVEHGLETGSYNAMENFSEGLASGPLVSKIPILGKRILGPYTEWLFQDWIPRLKMTMYKHALERNLERYKGEMDAGKITRDQVVENTAKQANSAFGELNYNWIGRNKSLQDALRAFLIAPDFLEARAKFVGEAIKPYGREQLVALGLLAATQYITARIINQQMDDDPHWEIQNAFKFIVGKHSYELRSVPGDIVHLISDPKKFSVARISPLLRSTIEGITGRDYRGVKRDAMEQLKDFAKLPTPISIRQQDDRRWWESFLNAFGVHERSYTAGQEVGELARAYREKVKGKPSVEVIESEDSPYRKLRVALDYGNEKAAQQAIQDLRKDHTDAQIFQSMRQSLTHPFTGMKQSDEAKFRKSLEPVQAERYKEAQTERQERFKKFTAIWVRRGRR